MNMTRRTALGGLAGMAAAAGSQQPAEPVIRVDVRLVRLLVTVKNDAGDPIGTLTREQFRVRDSGVEQQLAVFEKSTRQPLSVALLVDTSLSTAKELKHEIDSISKFLKALFGEGNPDDKASLWSFSDEVRHSGGFTRNQKRILDQMRALKPESGTSAYDAVWFASGDLERRDGRKVIILVTDGSDTTSAKSFREALESAHRADAVIYPILVLPITNDAGRSTGGENALQLFASGTGGRVFSPRVGKELDQTFAAILSDLRTQYLLGYYPRNLPYSKERFHPVEVRVDSPQPLRVSTRSGYYGSS